MTNRKEPRESRLQRDNIVNVAPRSQLHAVDDRNENRKDDEARYDVRNSTKSATIQMLRILLNLRCILLSTGRVTTNRHRYQNISSVKFPFVFLRSKIYLEKSILDIKYIHGSMLKYDSLYTTLFITFRTRLQDTNNYFNNFRLL